MIIKHTVEYHDAMNRLIWTGRTYSSGEVASMIDTERKASVTVALRRISLMIHDYKEVAFSGTSVGREAPR
jgi:hypothetical protein